MNSWFQQMSLARVTLTLTVLTALLGFFYNQNIVSQEFVDRYLLSPMAIVALPMMVMLIVYELFPSENDTQRLRQNRKSALVVLMVLFFYHLGLGILGRSW